MIREYFKFFVNGGVLGIIAWGLQLFIYWMLGGDSARMYAVASALTYVPLVIVNYRLQRAWIFKRDGLFLRFVIANSVIMLLVSIFSPLCLQLVDLIVGPPWGDRVGFVIASLLCSIPSFMLKRYWVFSQ